MSDLSNVRHAVVYCVSIRALEMEKGKESGHTLEAVGQHLGRVAMCGNGSVQGAVVSFSIHRIACIANTSDATGGQALSAATASQAGPAADAGLFLQQSAAPGRCRIGVVGGRRCRSRTVDAACDGSFVARTIDVHVIGRLADGRAIERR